MKTIYRLPGLLIAILTGCLAAVVCAQSPNPSPKAEIERGVCAFKNKDYALAQKDFEKALELDPTNKLLPLFIARAVFFQYDPNVETPNNLAKGRNAIAAYLKVLVGDPDNGEAVYAVSDLYSHTDPDHLPEIAANETVPKQVRAHIYVNLASKLNTCANDITAENRREVRKNGQTLYSYTMPRIASEFNKAQICARDGIAFVEKAIELLPNDESAWSYKASLLIQSARLAEMQQRTNEKAIFDKHVQEAKSVFLKIADERREKQNKADAEALQQSKDKERTTDEAAAGLANFVATGKLRKEPNIDEYDVESPLEKLISLVPEYKKGQQKPSLPVKLPWKPFVSADREFSALMPSPVESIGKNNRFYSVTSEDISYSVTYMDIPPPAPVGIEPMMASMVWGISDTVCNFSLMAKSPCEVNFAKKILLGLYPGMQYDITESKCDRVYPGLIRVYATPNRMYAIVVTGADEHDPRITKFLNSISLKR